MKSVETEENGDDSEKEEKEMDYLGKSDLKQFQKVLNIENSVVYIGSPSHHPEIIHTPINSGRPILSAQSHYQIPQELEQDQEHVVNKMLLFNLKKEL